MWEAASRAREGEESWLRGRSRGRCSRGASRRSWAWIRILPLGTNKSVEQRRRQGLNPTRRLSAQPSPADPRRASGLDKNLPLISARRPRSALIPIKSTEQAVYKQREGTAASFFFSLFYIHPCSRKRRCAAGKAAAPTVKISDPKIGLQ